MSRTRPPSTRGVLRGSPTVRLRAGFVVIAMVLSAFGARLVQLQGIDPGSYAQMAAQEGTVTVVIPSLRGEITDRNGQPLADSVDGLMVVADPQLTSPQAPRIARFLYNRLGVDYISTLQKLREPDSRFEYIDRRVPSTLAMDVMARAQALKLDGLSTRRDPVRDYPSGDVAANLVGFMGTDEALAGFERTFNSLLAGRDGKATYEVGDGNVIPLGANSTTPAVDGTDLRTTIDRDLQFYSQRILSQAIREANAESGLAIVMDSHTGEVLTLADEPTFDPNAPLDSPKENYGSRALQDPYEPGSVEKVLTLSSLIDAGKVTDRTRLRVPGSLSREDRVIHDWFAHGLIHLTLAGVLAKSSNIGTVLAADHFKHGQLRAYLTRFGFGRPTDVGVRGESAGILPDPTLWTHQTQDRIAFGQSVSVNALQMATAVNTIANGGVRVSPSLIEGSARTDDGEVVGTDTTTTRRVVSAEAAHQMSLMMERVIDPVAGVAPQAAVPGYRVAGKTGTAQRVGAGCGCYDGTYTVSFAGFAPADAPRFTVYVVVQNPRNGGGGGSVAGPVFSKIMSYALRHYGVPPTGTAPSRLPVTW